MAGYIVTSYLFGWLSGLLGVENYALTVGSQGIYENIAFNLETIEKNIDSIAITAKELSEKDKDTPLIIKIKETLHESQKNNPPNQDEIVKIIDYKPTLKEKLEMFFYELRY